MTEHQISSRDACKSDARVSCSCGQQQLADYDKAFERSFGLIAYVVNRFIIDHIVASVRALDFDYETLVIFGVLSHQNVAHCMPPGSFPSTTLSDTGGLTPEADPLKPIKLQDLCEITRIPRETVRRKLNLLHERNFVTRTEQGWMLNAASIDVDMRDFTQQRVRAMLATANQAMLILRDAETALKSAPC